MVFILANGYCSIDLDLGRQMQNDLRDEARKYEQNRRKVSVEFRTKS